MSTKITDARISENELAKLVTTRTPLFYMANLGSEVSRALLGYQKKDFKSMRAATARAKDIITKVEKFSEMKGRTGELEILKSIIDALNAKKLEVDENQLMNYFTPFASRLMS